MPATPSQALARLVLPETPVGPLVLVASDRGLRALRFGLPGGPEPRVSSDPSEAARAHLEAGRRYLEASLEGAFEDEDSGAYPPLPELDLEGGTPFQRRVWEALLRIPRGEVQSYGQVCRTLGAGSARAVGQAVGANPIPILIPCHRVITSNGELGGFSGGLERKVTLLRLEGRAAEGPSFHAPLAGVEQGALAL